MYEIRYDYDDGYECVNDVIETFNGDWFELRGYIGQLRRTGCFNIEATAMDI